MSFAAALAISVLLACFMAAALVGIGLLVPTLLERIKDVSEYVERSGKIEGTMHAILVGIAILFLAALDLLMAVGITSIWSMV